MAKWISLRAALALLIAGWSVGAGELSAQAPVDTIAYDRQVQLAEDFLTAFAAGDLGQQRETLRQLRQAVEASTAGPNVYSLAEINLALRDLDVALATTPENLELAKRSLEQMLLAEQQHQADNQAEAAQSYDAAIRMASAVYGPRSYFTLLLRIFAARNLASSEADIDQTLARLHAALADLEAIGLADSHLYCLTMTSICVAYGMRKDFENATRFGQSAIEIHQRRQTNFGSNYAQIVSQQANMLNSLGKSQQSLQTTRAALQTALPNVGVDARFSMRIFREYAIAKIRLNDPENVSAAFDHSFALADAIPGCPDDTKLTILNEHLDFLNSVGDQNRIAAVKQQIDKVRGYKLQPSRYSDPK